MTRTNPKSEPSPSPGIRRAKRRAHFHAGPVSERNRLQGHHLLQAVHGSAVRGEEGGSDLPD